MQQQENLKSDRDQEAHAHLDPSPRWSQRFANRSQGVQAARREPPRRLRLAGPSETHRWPTRNVATIVTPRVTHRERIENIAPAHAQKRNLKDTTKTAKTPPSENPATLRRIRLASNRFAGRRTKISPVSPRKDRKFFDFATARPTCRLKYRWPRRCPFKLALIQNPNPGLLSGR